MNIVKYAILLSISLIAFAVSIYFKCGYLASVAFVFLFTVFDTIGWGEAIHNKERYHDKSIVIPYRFMQNIFMYFGFFSLWFIFGWKSTAAAAIMWWFGVCDVLYYLLLPFPLRRIVNDQLYDYDWMKNWSVHLVISVIIPGYICDRTMFIILSVLGIILSILI